MRQPPFHSGPPRFDVGLAPIALAEWFLPDDQAAWLPEKNRLLDHHQQEVFLATAASGPAQAEVKTLICGALGQSSYDNEPPLVAAARLVSDDLVIMENLDGRWTNTACCLCNPTFFSAQFAIGKSLELLHDAVPDGDFGLAKRIGRVFTNLAPDTILERHNWTVQWSDARYTPDGMPLREAAAHADIAQGTDQLFLREERQTVRKLPVTGAVLFTIRIRLAKLSELLANHQHRLAFEAAWTQAPHHVRSYKKWSVLERHVARLLAATQLS